MCLLKDFDLLELTQPRRGGGGGGGASAVPCRVCCVGICLFDFCSLDHMMICLFDFCSLDHMMIMIMMISIFN